MPRGIPKNPKQHFYLAAGQIEYVEGTEKVAKSALSTGIHVTKHDCINVKGLMNIQVLLQMQFLNQFNKTHTTETPVEITNVQITAISYLGAFTAEGFSKETEHEEKPAEEKKTELKVVENSTPAAETEGAKKEETPAPTPAVVAEEPKQMATADAVTPEGVAVEQKTVSVPAEPVADKQPLVEVTTQPVVVPPTV